MTRYETISLVVAALGLVTVIASIWFLRGQVKLMGAQTQRLNHTLEMSAESALDSLFVFITQAYMDHPRLRSVFNESEGPVRFEDLDNDDQLRANSLAESLSDAMERAIRFQQQGLSSPSQLQPWIEDSIRNSAFLRRWLRAHAALYAPDLVHLAVGFADETDPADVERRRPRS